MTSAIAITFNIGAICGGIVFGTISERIGRLRAITIAAMLALPAIPFWAFGSTPVILAIGAFFMQFAVQGAWGVVPVYLNELSPNEVRGTFPGFAYQIGNLIAAMNGPLQSKIGEARGGEYSFGLALVVGTVAVSLTILSLLGPEVRGTIFASPNKLQGCRLNGISFRVGRTCPSFEEHGFDRESSFQFRERNPCPPFGAPKAGPEPSSCISNALTHHNDAHRFRLSARLRPE